VRSPRADRKRVGEAVSGNVAVDIGEGGRMPAVANRRIATIRAAATIVQDGRDTSTPAARSRADEPDLLGG
jgi:hypothetical protein